MRPAIAISTAIAVLGLAGEARATYSIVAVDGDTRQVGGAGTSCIGARSVRVIYGGVPGAGVVHAQALGGGPGKDAAVAQLGAGVAPAAIILAITAPAFDPQAARRQYGIVDLAGRAAGFTGADNGGFAADRQGRAGAFTYSVQGNILTSGAVLEQAEAAVAAGGGDLADRLMRALEAGAAGGEGDSRCTAGGIPSDSAFLEVDRDGEAAGEFLRLEVTGSAPASPLVALRARYDGWRVAHPCPVTPDAGTDPGADAAGCCQGSAAPAGAAALALLVLLRRRRRGPTLPG